MWQELGIGEFKESTDKNGAVIKWKDKDGIWHTKTIYHTDKSGIPVCYTAPSYSNYKRYLKSYKE
jgi:hypothetical protein